MAATPSQMLQLGTQLPAFSLPDAVTGKSVSARELLGAPGIVVAFICNHCPFVVHILDQLVEFGAWCQQAGIKMVAISSNDVSGYPQDGPGPMREMAQRKNFSFPYLYDETQDVARAFRAACTPDFYLFDGQGHLAYRGQFDASRPGNGVPVTGSDLRAAVTALLAGRSPAARQTPSVGCSLKWKTGQAPDWA
jgi:peroxiredoxin